MMNYLNHTYWFFGLTFLCFSPITSGAATNLNFLGIATDQENGEIIYREVHCMSPTDSWREDNQPWQSKVIYITPQNKILAIKKLNFESSPDSLLSSTLSPKTVNPKWVPAYEFEHLDIGFRETISYTEGKLALRRKATSDASWESRYYLLDDQNHSDSKDYIADAGFNNYIQNQLPRLLSGESLTVTYFSAPRLDTITFKIKLTNVKDDLAYIQVYPQNPFIRWLVDPINLIYEKASRKLLSFSGLTNVPANPDKNFNADIEYHYGGSLDEFCG